MGLTSAPWPRGSFLVGENLFNSHILWNPFLVGVFLIRVKHETWDISLYTHAYRPSKNMLDPSASSRQSRGGSSALLQELYLLAALYWITRQLYLMGYGVWFVIILLYIYIYIYSKKRSIYWLIPRASIIKCQGTWLNPIGLIFGVSLQAFQRALSLSGVLLCSWPGGGCSSPS